MKKLHLRTSTAWNLAGSVAPLLLGLVFIPYLIGEVKLESFGVLTLVWALIGYFSVFDFGIGRALTHQVSIHRAGPAPEELYGITKIGLRIVAAFGLIGGLILGGLSWELGTNWLNITAPLQASTVNCLLISAIGIPLTTITIGLRGILEGFEDFRTSNILRILLGCANFILPAASVFFLGPSLEYMVASLVFSRLLILWAHWISIKRHLPNWYHPTTLNKGAVHRLFSFGAWMTLSNMVGPLMVTADRFIISYLLGGASVAFYTVPFDLIVRLLVVPAALTGSLFPRFASLFASDSAEFKRIYWRGLTAVLLVMVPVCATIAFGSRWGLTIWLGADFAAKAWPIATVLAVGLLFNAAAQIPHAALQAAGGVRATALLHTAEFVFYVPVLYFSLLSFGLVGAAVAWTTRVFVDLVILLILAKRRIQ